MNIQITEDTVTVVRQTTDKRASNDSAFWYALLQELNKRGFVLIKKLMSKDGHLVSDNEYYLRAKKPTKQPEGTIYCLTDGSYQIRSIAQSYNAGCMVILDVIRF